MTIHSSDFDKTNSSFYSVLQKGRKGIEPSSEKVVAVFTETRSQHLIARHCFVCIAYLRETLLSVKTWKKKKQKNIKEG